MGEILQPSHDQGVQRRPDVAGRVDHCDPNGTGPEAQCVIRGCPEDRHAHVPLALSAGVNARALEKLAVAVHASYGDDTIDAVARITRGVLDNRPVERTDVLDDALLVEVITFAGIYRTLFQLVNTDGPDYVSSCIAFETDGSGSRQHSSRN